MQAFRAATTVDQRGELHVSDVPFRPGTPVEVLVLEQVADVGTSAWSGLHGAAEGSLDRPSDQRMRLAKEQYRLAGQYPNEYVVLVGDRIVHHSSDRRQAAQAYDRAALDSSPRRPVIVRPGGRLRKPPVVRGRALTRKLGRTR